jgi:hypothetical protein
MEKKNTNHQKTTGEKRQTPMKRQQIKRQTPMKRQQIKEKHQSSTDNR